MWTWSDVNPHLYFNTHIQIDGQIKMTVAIICWNNFYFDEVDVRSYINS